MRPLRLHPIAWAIACLVPTGALAGTGLPPLQVDPALLGASPPPARPPAPAPAAGTASPTTKAPGPPAPPLAPAAPAGPQTITLQADRLRGIQGVQMQAIGKVAVHQGARALFADKLTFFQAQDRVVAEGHVRLYEENASVFGPLLNLKLDTNQGFMDLPTYLWGPTHGRGQGTRLLFKGQGRYRVEKGSYTTCPVGNNDWFLHVSDLDLDRTTQVGTAYNGYIDFKGVPILYVPWFTFPLSRARKSGFLTPSLGTSGNNGAQITTPYYFNIAPNFDDTLTPTIMAKRGLLLGDQFRYLEPTYSGVFEGQVLPNDRITGTTRYLLDFQHTQTLAPGWAAYINAEKVSDATYFTDLSTNLANIATVTLPQAASVVYTGGGWWSFSGLFQRYQTLQLPNAPVVPPYTTAPQLALGGTDYNGPFGTTFAFTAQYDNFVHPTLPSGQRLVVNPSVSLPLENSFAYVTPKIGLWASDYALNRTTSPLPDAHFAVPILSVDSGVTFERDTSFRGTRYVQTLEPRLYYLYVPYHNQDNIPLFDTTAADFNFVQMFSDNQFTGYDRINDANQVTAGLTSRFLERATGIERLRASVGQIFYFKNQQVGLPGIPLRTRHTSDVLSEVSGPITTMWNLYGLWEYNPQVRGTAQYDIGTHFTPAPGRVINFDYRYSAATLLPTPAMRMIDVSSEWPITRRITGLMRWNYDFLGARLLEGLAGIEYNGGCWALRLVANHIQTTTSQASNSFFVQLELNGLSIGENPLDVLRSNIAGYAKTND
ncbi:MAG: LPS-assembly protein LptD [Betaproteobacteria bacterium]|nr:LPS-assembly protein LptD [Betaproteobacteria bacterium]